MRWEPETGDPDVKELAIAAVCVEVNARLRDFTLERIIEERHQAWAGAYWDHSGPGSTRQRARAIDQLYDIAAPVPGAIPGPQANEFLNRVQRLIRDAIVAANGKVTTALD